MSRVARSRLFSSWSALAETSRRTVRIVPSTGLRTALKATFTPRRSAWATSPGVACSGFLASQRPSAMPRRIWLVMTPELPRAPMSERA